MPLSHLDSVSNKKNSLLGPFWGGGLVISALLGVNEHLLVTSPEEVRQRGKFPKPCHMLTTDKTNSFHHVFASVFMTTLASV